MKKNTITLILILVSICLYAQKPRARDLGIKFDGTTGKNNAITDEACDAQPDWVCKSTREEYILEGITTLLMVVVFYAWAIVFLSL